MRDSCEFCGQSSNEATLINTTKNSLLINNKFYEFAYIFNDLLGGNQFTSFGEWICESCKDVMVNFYLLKRNIKFSHEHLMRLILKNQIDEFLNENAQNIENIKLIKAENSITLKCEGLAVQQNNIDVFKSENQKPEICVEQEIDEFYEENDQQQDAGYEDLISYHCSKCNQIESTENDSEIHEFLKHSSFGAQIQLEIENWKAYSADAEQIFYVCIFCSVHLESFDSMLLHTLNLHAPDILFQINEALNIPSHLIEFSVINTYLNNIKECLKNEKANSVEFEQKKYFYDIYGELDEEIISNRGDVQEVEINEISDEVSELAKSPIKKEKQDKLSDDLSASDKEWVRNEITKSKCFVSTEKGEQRTVYRCSISSDCSHVSNSASGLRYHLIMKHLKHRTDIQERQRHNSNDIIESFPYVAKNSNKNTCTDCNLKFKDSRLLNLHANCHELFLTISNYSSSIFPSCNTCNQKFVDDSSLKQHLTKHDNNENLLEPIEVEGVIRQQGKVLGPIGPSFGETNITDFAWKCGHCEKFFMKEEYCNFHLMLCHSVSFVCPVDKLKFSGFKSVSLFVHHLRNKHSDLFHDLVFTCSFCKMEFMSIYDKLNHMKNCDRKNIQCDHCGKRFWRKGELIAHLKYVTGEVQFQCSLCTKTCISASDLKIHLRSHSKIKPYKCSLCTKTFRTLAARSAHLESHNLNIVFSCEVCGKIFKQRQLYRRHMKSTHEK